MSMLLRWGQAWSDCFNECLFRDDELDNGRPPDGVVPVVAEGILSMVGFHPERIDAARPKVIEFIRQLPDEFLKSKGGGWAFVNLCRDRNGNQWANLHRTMEQLIQLAIGCGLGGYCLPREAWKALPGGLPYVWFDLSANGGRTETSK